MRTVTVALLSTLALSFATALPAQSEWFETFEADCDGWEAGGQYGFGPGYGPYFVVTTVRLTTGNFFGETGATLVETSSDTQLMPVTTMSGQPYPAPMAKTWSGELATGTYYAVADQIWYNGTDATGTVFSRHKLKSGPFDCMSGQGCTPGAWKNRLLKIGAWAATGLSPNDNFDAVFGVNYFGANFTLRDGVNQGGGGLNKVARHGTAALLNALHPSVDYPFTAAQVIAAVRAGNVDALVSANELGCNSF